MGMNELRRKYGENKKMRQLLNAAVRAELAAGDLVLDSIETASTVLRSVRRRGVGGEVEELATRYLNTLDLIANEMRDEILDRYAGEGEEQ